MTTQTLTATYSGAATAASVRLGLEQQPVGDNSLTGTDLAQMLALVRAGISARTYRPAACPASVVNGQVVVPLEIWVWPVPLTLDYALWPNMGTMGAGTAISQEREFDLVIDFTRRTELPFVVSACSWQWSDLPCFNAQGEEVARPAVTVTDSAVLVNAEVLGVLRIRCMAEGFAHTLTLRLDKGTSSITDVAAVVSGSWIEDATAQTETIELELPGCANTLLAACDDGTLLRERVYGTVSEDEETVPVVYYNDCTGQVLVVRNELP